MLNMLQTIFHSMLPSIIIDAQERQEVISYLWERERDEARSSQIAVQLQLERATLSWYQLWWTTETFPTPGDTIVLNVTQRRDMSFQRLISSYESPRSRRFPVDSFSHLMYIVETKDFFSIQTTRRSIWTTRRSQRRWRSRGRSASVTAKETYVNFFTNESGKLM